MSLFQWAPCSSRTFCVHSGLEVRKAWWSGPRFQQPNGRKVRSASNSSSDFPHNVPNDRIHLCGDGWNSRRRSRFLCCERTQPKL